MDFDSKLKLKNRVTIMAANPDFKEEKKHIYMFNIIQKPGEYWFYQAGEYSNSGTRESMLNVPINIPFPIEAGKVKYINLM